MAERLRFQTAANIKMGPFVDREDGASPETGLSISLSNVQVSKNGGAFAQKHQSSTPTHDVDGWYLVALDTGDTDTLGRLTVKIHDSGALPVWRHFEIVPQPVYDAEVLGTGNLQVETVAFSDTGVNNRLSRIQAEVDTGIRAHVSDVDTGIHDTIADLDTGLRAHITASAGGTPPDTGAIASAVWSFTTRALTAFNHDTGVAHTTWNFATRSVTNVTGFSDTGVNDRLTKILGDTDTGLRDAISDARYVDTGPTADLAALRSGVNVAAIRSDTGAASRLQKLAGNQLKEDGTFDTGTGQVTNTFNVQASVTLDTGTPINVQVDIPAIAAGVWSAGSRTLTDIDTGVITSGVWSASARTLTNYHDTGIDQDLTRVISRVAEADTGIRDAIADIDTGLRDAISDIGGSVDTGSIVDAVWGAQRSAHADTGTFGEHLGGDLGGGTASVDTGAIADAVWGKDSRTLTSINDTGLNQRLDVIRSDTDTGLRSAILASAYVDTGLRDALADLDTGLRDYITDTVPSSDITAIKAQTDKLTFDTGNEILADIRKVNNVTVTGTGDTGAGDTWRPA